MNDRSRMILDVASRIAPELIAVSIMKDFKFNESTVAREAASYAEALIAHIEEREREFVEREDRRDAFGVDVANASGAKLHSPEWHEVLRRAQAEFDRLERSDAV
jgi:hypothetical protein